jgi:hypothetical protein
MAKRKPTLVERAVKAKTARRYAQRLILLRTWAKNTTTLQARGAVLLRSLRDAFGCI